MDKSLSQKSIDVKYFSQFAEITGKTSEVYKTETITLEDLWYELDSLYRLSNSGYFIASVRPAINHQFCEWQDRISNGDTVSFIPPVSGG